MHRSSHQPLITERALQMRSWLTPTEQKLWAEIAGCRLGVWFRRQVPIGRYVADFVTPSVRLVVEVDGEHHRRQRVADARRDRVMKRLGYRVLRVPAWLVDRNLTEAVARIRAELRTKAPHCRGFLKGVCIPSDTLPLRTFGSEHFPDRLPDARTDRCCAGSANLNDCVRAAPSSVRCCERDTFASAWVHGSSFNDCKPLSCISRALVGLTEHPALGPSGDLDLELRHRRVEPADPDTAQAAIAANSPQSCQEAHPSPPQLLPPETIQRIIRAEYPEFRSCYESALGRNRDAAGSVSVRFAIDEDGTVTSAEVVKNTLRDCEAVRCVRDHYRAMKFPATHTKVTVVYPVAFAPK